MGTLVAVYRGFEIWLSAPDEFVPGVVYYIPSGPCDIPGYWYTREGAEGAIDKQYDTTQVLVEIYRGVEIYFQYYTVTGLFNAYSAKIGIHTKFFPDYDLAGCKAWIDSELGVTPPTEPSEILGKFGAVLASVGFVGMIVDSARKG